MSDDYRTVGVHMPTDWIDHAEELAEEYDCSRAAVFRELIEQGFIATRDEMLPFNPDEQTRRSAAEMAEEGDHPRWTESEPHW